MSVVATADLHGVCERQFYGVPDYEDDKPEPNIPVGATYPDRDGVEWLRHPLGWIVAGDARPQPWREVQRWFC